MPTNKTVLVHGVDGTAYAVELVDTGNTDPQGRELYHIAVDADLNVGTVEIGKVDQGAAGASPWLVKSPSDGAFSIPITLTVTSGAYTIGDVVGGLITLPGMVSAAGKRGMITNIVLSGVVANPYNLYFFASDIATPAADNAVGTLVAADIAMCKGVVPIGAQHYTASPLAAFNVATLLPSNANLPLEYSCTTTTLYAYLTALAVTSPGTTVLTLTVKGLWLD